jgi:hypothetical protein
MLAYDTFLPRFETPDANAQTPTATDLNPFGSKGISIAFPETENIPADVSHETVVYEGYVKGVGLKAPIVVGGWGYDTTGNPVPSGGDGEFLTNYKNRADKWKVGPLDIRWDNSRKVWNASGSAGLFLGTVGANIAYGSSGPVWLVEFKRSLVIPGNKPFGSSNKIVTAWENVLSYGDVLYNGTSVILTMSNNEYVIIGTLNTCRS